MKRVRGKGRQGEQRGKEKVRDSGNDSGYKGSPLRAHTHTHTHTHTHLNPVRSLRRRRLGLILHHRRNPLRVGAEARLCDDTIDIRGEGFRGEGVAVHLRTHGRE